MESRYGLWNGVSALYSDSGRQLGEENARPFVLNHHVPAETINCKYKGSRSGRQINMSALRIAMQNFDEALAITGAVRKHHLQNIPEKQPLGIWDLYIIARASIALVAYQKRFARQSSLEPSVCDALSSQYQFISGVFMICRDMMEQGDDAITQNSPISAEMLYSYADRRGIFISFNGMACAGSTKKIMDFLEFCNTGALAKADTEYDLAQLVCEPSNWYQYALATVELDCFIEQERADLSLQTPSVDVEITHRSAAIYSGLRAYCCLIADGLGQVDQGIGFDDQVLARQNAILQILGRPAIKRIPTQHLKDRLA